MEAAETSPSPRRWSKRTLLVVVSLLILAVLLLVLSVTGFARSIGVVLQAFHALSDSDPIAPDRAAPTGSAVTDLQSAPAREPANTSTAPVAAASVAAGSAPRASNGAGGTRETEAVPIEAAGASGGGSATGDDEATGNGGAGGGGGGGAASSAGAGGATPTVWDEVLRGALTVLGRTTISMCGPNTCNAGQVCCNPSCGICVNPGATCDQTQCTSAPRAPTTVLCGSGQCNDGQVCCNPSCGICAAPGESCSKDACP